MISNSVEILKELEPSIDIAYGRVRLVNKDNEAIVDVGKNWEKSRKCMKEKMCIPHQGVFHKRSLFKKFGNFSTNYSIASDYDFIRRVLLDQNIYYLDLIVSSMRVGGISSDPKNTFVRLEEIRQINKKYLAITVNKPENQIINAPIARHPIKRKEMAIVDNGKEAITEIEVIK